jgi:hypothetical protein
MHREIVSDLVFNPREPEHDHFVFEGIDYPATKADLVDFIQSGSIDPDSINLIASLPDRTFTSRDDIWRAMAEATRRFGSGGRNLGTPRDDMGKQATNTREP